MIGQSTLDPGLKEVCFRILPGFTAFPDKKNRASGLGLVLGPL